MSATKSVYSFYPVQQASSQSNDETVAVPPKRSPLQKNNNKQKARTTKNSPPVEEEEEAEKISDENFAVYDVPKPFIQLLHRKSTSASAKFRSLVPTPVDVWYDNGADGIFQGSLDLGKEYTVNSYEGHVFYFTARGDKSKVFARHTVARDQVLYVVTDPDHPAPKEMLDHLEKEEAFMADYLRRSGGVQWRHYFGPDGRPRGPPSLPMWPAQEIGQIHRVRTTEGYWTCLNYKNPALCHSQHPIDLTLEVVSTKPKVFIIKNFLNEIEVTSIIQYAKPRMDSSYVGNSDAGGARKSDTRTSENTWVSRSNSFPVMETLFHRAEELLNISRLDYRNTEDLQVVHYLTGQRYDSHHDWGVSGYPESRYITLLLYLTDMVSQDAGGETAFPKAAGGKGLKIHPGKGSAVLFYNLLEDGNGDDLTLHAALPVKKGEKWLANFWVWDPKRK
jgi:prolyl 4-hydroxylase